MTIRVLTRRAAIAALGAAALAPAAAFAQAPARFRAIEVDVGPLRANLGDPTAAWTEEFLRPALERALAGHYAPGDRNGATLVARIAWIYFGPDNGGPSGFWFGRDSMEGDLIVRSPRGGVVSEIPLRAQSPYLPNPTSQAQWVQWNRSRVQALAQAFAGWTPQQLGL